jgi:DNA-directed RNA polymerase specialized sigma24 family protein
MGLMEKDTFQVLIDQAQRGDQTAVHDLMSQFEPNVLHSARALLVGLRYRLPIEPSDICQTVFCSFFVKLLQGRLKLDQAEDMLKLLSIMTRNLVYDEIRKQRTHRRGARQEAESDGTHDVLSEVAARGGTPSYIVACHELISEIRRRLDEDEIRLLDWRIAGGNWAELAATMNCGADALRKRLDRALARVLGELNIDPRSVT